MDRNSILAEIKRTAAQNDGAPLGWRKFQSETGINVTAWRGKYWARWGDAVIEAGFTPNEMVASIEDSELIEKYVGLVRELGRLPTADDLKLKANNDSDFPSEKTYRRFGTKAEIVQSVTEHCRGRDEHEDILQLCDSYAPPIRQQTDEPDDDAAVLGYVYLMQSGRFYKIGFTNSVGRREYELSIQLPERAETVHVIQTDDPPGIEAYWHNRFQSKRKNGEWFELTAADVRAFKRRTFM